MEDELSVEDDVLSDLEEQLFKHLKLIQKFHFVDQMPLQSASHVHMTNELDQCITAGHVWILYVLSINLFCAINVIG